jgi:oligoribonuclease NrnB/cAMP/cGMP phosphodiesterase (DHH superfamily)
MKTVCIYHSVDLDGWMSAAIVKHYYKLNSKKYLEGDMEDIADNDSIAFIGYNYGQPIPNLSEYSKVIMCDISFPKNEMEKIANSGIGVSNFIWIDHHISAIKDMSETHFAKTANGLRDTKYAACELTWKYFFPNKPMPEIVRLLGRYDCFGHRQIWKSVVNYEGLYEVSNHGNVRSLHKEIKELSIANSKRGYRVVSLYKDGSATMKNVHQLVAQAFIPNPESKPCINHKDFNRLNNHVENLEWCTYAENNEHSIKEGQRGKKVFQMDSEYNVISEFDSIIEAEKQTGIQSQNIGKVCKGERETAGGFKWEYNLEKTCVKQFVPQDEEQKVLEFQYGARQCVSNYEEAYKYLEDNLSNIPDYALNTNTNIELKGKSIYSYLCTEAKQVYKNGFEIQFYWAEDIGRTNGNPKQCNAKFICINKERFNPINFGIDYHADGYDGCACFHYADGKWKFSIYNDDGSVDCSVIAKQFGGGGHKGAAGFILNTKEFNNLIK